MSGTNHARRRTSRGPRVDPLALTAVLAPLLTLALLLVVSPGATTSSARDPELAPLDRADLVCPGALGRDSEASAGNTGQLGGVLELRRIGGRDAEPDEVDLPAGALVSTTSQRPVLVTAHDELAPGLVGLRAESRQLASSPCLDARPETWFVGLGARAEHSSELELVNPDVGAAIVDISVFTRRGPHEVPELRGIRVPGRSTIDLDLATIVPRRRDLAAQVLVSRGRAMVSARDTLTDLARGKTSQDWLPGEPSAAIAVDLVGLPSGRGGRVVSIANPSDDEARVDLKIVAPENVFTPAGFEQIRVRPHALASVHLGKLLSGEAGRGAIGVRLSSSTPIRASLSSYVGGDLALAGQALLVAGDPATAVVPPGETQLLISGATGAGVAQVEARDEGGQQLTTERVELARDQAVAVDLPEGTRWVTVHVSRASAHAALLVERRGATVVPFVTPARFGLIPDVAAALP